MLLVISRALRLPHSLLVKLILISCLWIFITVKLGQMVWVCHWARHVSDLTLGFEMVICQSVHPEPPPHSDHDQHQHNLPHTRTLKNSLQPYIIWQIPSKWDFLTLYSGRREFTVSLANANATSEGQWYSWYTAMRYTVAKSDVQGCVFAQYLLLMLHRFEITMKIWVAWYDYSFVFVVHVILLRYVFKNFMHVLFAI